MNRHQYQAMPKSEREQDEGRTPEDGIAPQRPKAHGLRSGTLDWVTLAQLALLIIIPAFMIFNIKSFSTPSPFQLRFGGSISIPQWLIVIAVEFSTLFVNVIQSLRSALTSKHLTKRLSGRSLTLSTLINSLENAPFFSQLRGLRWLLFGRTVLLLISFGLVLADKVSFTQIPVDGTILFNVTNERTRVITTQGNIPAQSNIPLTTNVLDIVGFGDLTSIRFQNQTFIVGPALNVNVPDSLLLGLVQACYPQSYYQYNISSSPPPSTGQFGNNSYSFPVPNAGKAMDLSVAANGNLMAGFRSLDQPTDSTESTIYTAFYIVTSEACIGYISWYKNVTLSGVLLAPSQYFLQDPEPIQCTQARFNLTEWEADRMLNVTLAFMQQADYADNLRGLQGVVDNTTTDYEYLVLQVLASASLNLSLDSSLPTPGDLPTSIHPSCVGKLDATCAGNYICAAEVLFATGLIEGTGMTILGVALQAFVAFFALLASIFLFWTSPPLITTWPAQWLSLLSEFNPGVIRDTVRGTSMGLNATQGGDLVFLSSIISGEEYPRLQLSDNDRGRIQMKIKHL